MTTRTDTLKVVYVVDGQSNVIGSFRAVGKEADALDRRVASAGKSMDAAADSGAHFGRVLGVGIGAAITATAFGLGVYIRNTIQAEQVQAQLAARIRDTGNAAGRTLEQLNAQARELQKVTPFDDNAVGGAQAALMVFREIEGLNFDRAVALSADLAVKWGTDMPTAAERLGTALANPERAFRSLATAGVSFTEAERESIKQMVEHGRQAEVVDAILDRLEGTIGSTAETAADTLGGAFTRLGNTVSSLLQGDSGSEGMVGLRDSVEDLIDVLNDPRTHQAIDDVASGILGIASAALSAIAEIDEFFGRMQRVATYRLGGNSDIGDRDQILYEIEQNRKALEGASEDPLFDLFNIGALKNEVTRRRATERGKELQDQLALNDLLFGDPDAPPKPIFIDPGDPASLDVDSHLRPKRRPGGFGPGTDTEAERAARALERAYQSLIARQRERLALFGDESQEAKAIYDTELGALRDLDGPKKEEIVQNARLLDQKRREAEEQEVMARLLREEEEARDRAARAIGNQISSMEFELSLIGMTNEERERAIALRHAGADATEAERERIASLATELARAYEAERVFDDIRDASIDLVSNLDNAGDAAERFGERIERMARRLLAERAVQALFQMFMGGGTDGASGETQGGVFDLFSGGSGFGFAKGAAFASAPPPLHSYVNQVHYQPRLFAFANGGVFAEAGPEAVMPLERGPDGSLGVRNYGSGVPDVNIKIVGAPSGSATASARMGPEGLDVEIFFKGAERHIASGIADGSSPVLQVLKARTNVKDVV